ncbi:RdRP protein [Rhizoctonia solani]|uniref:RdRP protein n=1 Tax=Rhizoctonia solani TaxID=456999 RepID=A0A8H7M922_9AGAM|nr:RdRP protein [Rhizoctonia solani]
MECGCLITFTIKPLSYSASLSGFLRNIAFSARIEDVQLALSNALHGGDFAQFGSEPINFDFQMHRNKRGGGFSHGGTGRAGTLTLPQVEIAEEFIRRYSGPAQLIVNSRQIFVAKSKKDLRQDVVARLLRTKYRDPQSEAERRLAERAEQLSVKVLLSRIEQGWIKRNSDSAFSSEYSINLGSSIKELSLHFDDTNRNIIITLAMDSDSDVNLEVDAFYIRFRYSDIEDIIFDNHSDTSKLLFRLRTSVSYEAKESMLTELRHLDIFNPTERRYTRYRITCLPFGEHEKLAKYISNTILVHLSRPAAKDFEKLAELARISKPWKKRIQLSLSNIFGPATIAELKRWIQRHKWEVAFQLQKILSNGLLNPQEYMSVRPMIEELVRTSRTEHVIKVLLDFVSRLEILNRRQEKEESRKKQPLRTSRRQGVDGDFPCLHVVVTPTRVTLEGPNPEQLNRVLRMYPDHWNHFLRVRFTDEEQSPFRADQEVDIPRFVKSRVGGVLKNGLTIAGRHFEYLAYSSSALKGELIHQVPPSFAITIYDSISQGIPCGDFSRDGQYPARMGARIAQAFSSTDLSISVSVEEILPIPDIERNDSIFTDGVGMISPEVAKMIWRSLNKLRKRRSYFLPAAYQVRLGGHKGMLAIDHRLEGSVICVRKSMDKFDSPSLDVEVARAFDRPGRCFLNRPLIMILETANRVQTDIFLALQHRAVRDTRQSMRCFDTVAELLEMHGLGASFKLPSLFTRLQNIGIEAEYCNSLGIKTILKNAETDILRELKHRARIPVPESWKLVGIADEFGFLEEGEVYACLRDKNQGPIYLEGPYLITRSPAIHPGDVQVVRAIGRPPTGSPFDKEPLPNTVVFSCKGQRSLPSCLGGGDLDGDLYDLINLTAWPDLTPQVLAEPAEYPPAPKKRIEGRSCTMDDVKDFICDFITSDMVGIISTQHLKLADFRASGLNDPDCLKLAELHSRAVDFPKSGTPVASSDMPRSGRMPRPDWDAGELGFRSTRDEVYPSQRALGHLYRAIRLSEEKLSHQGTHPTTRFGTDLNPRIHAHPLPRNRFDPISHYLRNSLARYIHVDDVPENYFIESVELLEEYVGELTRICNTYALTPRSIISEEEVVAGTILELTSQRRRRRDMISEMRTASSALVANVRDILRGMETGESDPEDWMLRSWAAHEAAIPGKAHDFAHFDVATLIKIAARGSTPASHHRCDLDTCRHPYMEPATVFIRGIPPSARQEDVQSSIASVLHGGSFSRLSSEPINFDFRFIVQSKPARNRIGTLTLPYEQLGSEFLANYGEYAHGRISVKGLRSTPYRSPQDEREQLATRGEDVNLSQRIRIAGFNQGYMQRSGAFLSEYSVDMSASSDVRTIDLYIDDSNRIILLEITVIKAGPTNGGLPFLGSLQSSTNYYVKFRYSDLYKITFDTDPGRSSSMILFQLNSPVSYESAGTMTGILQILSPDQPSRRNRLSSLTFDCEHSKIAKFVSRNLLVRLTHDRAVTFKRLYKSATTHRRIHNSPIYFTQSNMFSGTSIESLQRWIEGKEWKVAFQLSRILMDVLINPEEFASIMPTIDRLIESLPISQVYAVLLDFIARLEVLDRGESWEDPPSVSECLERATVTIRHPIAPVPRLRQTRENNSNGDFPCLHAIVTPTRVLLEGPVPEQLNRVLRMFPGNWDHFIRVRFTDEEKGQLKWDPDVNGPQFVRERVGKYLKRGLKIAGRRFEYLRYSNSSLKSHTVWFVHPFNDPQHGLQNASTIITAIGDFSRDIQCPARMGARIGQAFSSTDLSVTVPADKVIAINDIERNGYCFTDGVGTISPEFAEQMWRALVRLRGKRPYFVPASYQVRLGGYKGMLAIDYRLEGSVVCVRRSMDKFSSRSLDVEVSRAFDRPGPCFLNRPLIMLLDTGSQVPIEAFLGLQRKAEEDTKAAMRSFSSAARALEIYGLGDSYKIPSLLLKMEKLEVDLGQLESLGLNTVLKDAEADILRDLKHHARIPVPHSWKLVGIADEFDYLEPQEIYACVRDRDQSPIYLEGPFLVTRSPVIHPGDVQVVTAIGRPPPGSPFDIEPLENTIVFSCQGDRPLPNFLGGGDLDGDLYDLINLTKVPQLAPRVIHPPAEYPPATKRMIQNREATIDDVTDFICDYINSDMLGMVALRHLRLADERPLGVNDPDCLKLAELHNKAVDFQKSGTPVVFGELPLPGRAKPDWDAGEIRGRRGAQDTVYTSDRALGHLYRDIQLGDELRAGGTHPDVTFGPELLDVELIARPLEQSQYDHMTRRIRDLLAQHIRTRTRVSETTSTPRNDLVEAAGLLSEYTHELVRICNDYALAPRSTLSEEEVVAGTILERTSQRRKRQDRISDAERVGDIGPECAGCVAWAGRRFA